MIKERTTILLKISSSSFCLSICVVLACNCNKSCLDEGGKNISCIIYYLRTLWTIKKFIKTFHKISNVAWPNCNAPFSYKLFYCKANLWPWYLSDNINFETIHHVWVQNNPYGLKHFAISFYEILLGIKW